jgi:hypothetical protein
MFAVTDCRRSLPSALIPSSVVTLSADNLVPAHAIRGYPYGNPQIKKLARAFMHGHFPNFVLLSFTAAAFHRSRRRAALKFKTIMRQSGPLRAKL